MLVGALIAIVMLAGVVTAAVPKTGSDGGGGAPSSGAASDMVGSDIGAASGGAASGGTDVTPSNAFLPFGPRDKYNTKFSFTAKFTREPGTATIS